MTTEAAVRLGMPVCLVTYSLGVDSAGTDAIGFGYRPQTATAEGDRS
jgi:hypothetical protein